jgi:hypothetical protein
MKLETRVGEAPSHHHHSGSHGPPIRPVSTGASLPIIPIAAGVLALAAVAAMNIGWLHRLVSLAPPPSAAPAQQAKLGAAIEAEREVSQVLNRKDVTFGQVWGTSPHTACGYVGGAGQGQRRFIFARGGVKVDDGSDGFARTWSAKCESLAAGPWTARRAFVPHRRRGSERAG